MSSPSKIILILLLFLLVSCGGSNNSKKSDDSSGDQGARGERGQATGMPVDWNSVPEKFNPEIVEYQFHTVDLNFIDLSILGVTNQVRVSLSTSLVETGKLKIYRVWGKYASFGRIELNDSFDKLKIENYTGNQPYSCSKAISNRKLVRVEGGCNLYVEVVLPRSSEIEVYSGDNLVSKRYFPMPYGQLIETIDTGFNEDKLEAIENFLASYNATGKVPTLSSIELEDILKEFTFADEYKFSALNKLYRYLVDSEQLGVVIENSFTFSSEREKARRIVGLR